MIRVKFIKGKRNRYKFPIAFYICKIPIYPLVDGNINAYHKGMRTINFRIKRNVYTLFIKYD